MNVSVVIPTRGDVDLGPTLDSLPRDWQKVIWNNSQRPQDLAVYGRYAAIEECEHELVFTVDDDVVLAPGSAETIAAAYVPGTVVANQPQQFRDTGFYDDHCLVGFGAIFDRELPARAFTRIGISDATGPSGEDDWWEMYHEANGVRVGPIDARWFRRTCDVVFTTLTPRVLVDVPYTDREFASDASRMWRQARHFGERTRMLELARQVRDA